MQRALLPSLGGNPSTSLDEAVARLARAKVCMLFESLSCHRMILWAMQTYQEGPSRASLRRLMQCNCLVNACGCKHACLLSLMQKVRWGYIGLQASSCCQVRCCTAGWEVLLGTQRCPAVDGEVCAESPARGCQGRP